MQDPKAELQNALKDAMRKKDAQRRDALRLLTSAIKQEEVDQRKDLTAVEVTAILQKEAKKRRESIEELQKARRDEQAAQEQAELDIIEEFLPKQLGDDELRMIVSEVVAEVGATSMKEMGQVMQAVMPKIQGQADGKAVNNIVREFLG